MAVQNWDWVFHALGWTLAGLGLLLVFWAMYWDRSRGRKRCPKCWYSMEGAAKGEGGKYTCPECGRSIADDRTLHRTRRRLRRAVLGAFVCVVGYAVFVTPAVRREGWVVVTPTSVLILLASPERLKEIAFNSTWNPKIPYDYEIENELVRRGEEQSIYNWQADLLAWRIRRAANNLANPAEFRSYDVAAALSPAWWSSLIPFTSEDKASLFLTLRDILTSSVNFDMWIENGGDEASLFRMGNRIFVWAPRLEHPTLELVLTLLITKGQGDVVSVVNPKLPDYEPYRFHSIRMYDVTDIAPPSVERSVEPPSQDPRTWDSDGFYGELVFDYGEIYDLVDDITLNVRMDDWVDNGGELATIWAVQGWLVIWASPEMHDLVAERIESNRRRMQGVTSGPP